MLDQPQEHNPWHAAEMRYQPGQQVHGTVTRIAPLGVFVQLEPDLIGVIYTFELGTGMGALSGFTVGQKLDVYVKSLDVGRKRLELSLREPAFPAPLAEHALPATLRRNISSEVSSWPAEREAALILDQQYQARACPACQRVVESSWRYCVYCGDSLQRHCPACERVQPNLPDARYCYACGALLA